MHADHITPWSKGGKTDTLTADALRRLQPQEVGRLTATSTTAAGAHDCVTILRIRGISWTRIGQASRRIKRGGLERFSGQD